MTIQKYDGFLNESKKYWSNGKIIEYKKTIRLLYNEYFDKTKFNRIPFYKIKLVGSLANGNFKPNESDIDFMIYALGEVESSISIGIIDYINSELINIYGELEGKGGLVEVIGINDKFWWDF